MEPKEANMRAVLDSMKTIKAKLCTIEESQAKQESEREKVLEGLLKDEAEEEFYGQEVKW